MKFEASLSKELIIIVGLPKTVNVRLVNYKLRHQVVVVEACARCLGND